jgi:glycosyltransferase involved in cell wall biosynthesis
MVAVHKPAGTWKKVVSVYVALSEFSRRKFIAGGLPADKIVVKPNFLVRDPGVGSDRRGFGLYVGRISKEKGLPVLERAWERLPAEVPLKIIGGPVSDQKRPAANVQWLGPQPKERVFAELREAAFLVFPSECYENCPMTIIEAFASGRPVIASDGGSAAEMVRDGQTGLTFRVGDSADLAAKLSWALEHPAEMAAMGLRARQEFEAVYSPDGNYRRLMEIYRRAKAA